MRMIRLSAIPALAFWFLACGRGAQPEDAGTGDVPVDPDEMQPRETDAASGDTASSDAVDDLAADRPPAYCEGTMGAPGATLLVTDPNQANLIDVRPDVGWIAYSDYFDSLYVTQPGASPTKIGAKVSWASFAERADTLFAFVNYKAATDSADFLRWDPLGGTTVVGTNAFTWWFSSAPDGRAAIYLGNYNRTTMTADIVLWRAGLPPVTLAASVSAADSEVWITRDGRFAVATTGRAGRLLVVDIETGAARTLASDAWQFFYISADSTSIAYVSGYSAALGYGTLNVRALVGSSPGVQEPAVGPTLQYSPSGADLFFVGDWRGGGGSIRRVPASGGTSSLFGSGVAADIVEVAPDSTSVMYSPMSWDAAGPKELWLQPAGAEPFKLSSNATASFSFIFAEYRASSTRAVFSDEPDALGDVNLRTASWSPGVPPSISMLASRVFSHEADVENDRYVLYSKDVVEHEAWGDIYIANAETGATKMVAHCVDPYFLQVTGRRLVLTNPGTRDDGIYVVNLPAP